MNEQISTIETSRIVANPNNPRTRIEDVSDLVASIRENGLMQPIIVRWTKQKDESGITSGMRMRARCLIEFSFAARYSVALISCVRLSVGYLSVSGVSVYILMVSAAWRLLLSRTLA